MYLDVHDSARFSVSVEIRMRVLWSAVSALSEAAFTFECLLRQKLQEDIAIEFAGFRPREEVYKELLIGDNVAATPHPMIMTANEDHLPWDVLKGRLTELLIAVEEDDYARVRQLLRETVSGYTPDGEIVDWIHQQRRLEP
ncbi:hypothetical protein AF70_00018260 [Pseudomonas sp. KD5]|uniref:FlaA1/EpsC-like NDP-sugar epimerase n=1 Tax=Pseudomonas umsongensis TaxID=198618 RepID=A0ACC5MFG3_9PSED|nr:FlaA1/EpsC-like NDP-sugar epimerase [Pseudomonas umsongensis]NMN76285.1 hypothetical protein [Pseudomonas sp. KD5]